MRLPSAYRFDCDEVFIRKDPATGDVILSRKPGSWEDFFKLVETLGVPKDFMACRKNELPQERDLF